MLQKINAWKTSDGELHDDEMDALMHETRSNVCRLINLYYLPHSPDQAETVIGLIMNNIPEIRDIITAHTKERDRIVGERGAKP